MLQSIDDCYLTGKKVLPLAERRARSASPKKSRKQLPSDFFLADGPIAAKCTEDELSYNISANALSNQLKTILSLLMAKNLHITTTGTNTKYVIPIPFQLKMPPKLSEKNKISSPLNSRPSSPGKSLTSNSGSVTPVMISPPKPLKLVYNGLEYQEMDPSDDSFTSPSSKYKLAGGQKGKVLFTKRLLSDALSVINEGSESSRLSSVKVMKALQEAKSSGSVSPNLASPSLASPAKITMTEKPLPPVIPYNEAMANLMINDSIGSISDNTSFANLSLLPSGTSREPNSFLPTSVSLPIGLENLNGRPAQYETQLPHPVVEESQRYPDNVQTHSQSRTVSYSSVDSSGSSMTESLWNSLQESFALNNNNEYLPLAPSVELEESFSTDTESEVASSVLSYPIQNKTHPIEKESYSVESSTYSPSPPLQLHSPIKPLTISAESSQRKVLTSKDNFFDEDDRASRDLYIGVLGKIDSEEVKSFGKVEAAPIVLTSNHKEKDPIDTQIAPKETETDEKDSESLTKLAESSPKCDPFGDYSFNSGLGKRFSFPNSLENATNEAAIKDLVKQDNMKLEMASTKRHSFVSDDGQIEIPELDDYDLLINTRYNATSLYNTGSESGSVSIAPSRSINGSTTGSAVEPLGVPSENARAFARSQFSAMFPNSDSDTDVEQKIPKSKSNPDISNIGTAQRMRNYRRHSRGKSLHSIDFDYSSNLNKLIPPTPSNGSVINMENTPKDQPVNRNKTLPRIPNDQPETITKESKTPDSLIRAKSLRVEEPPNPVRYKVDFVDKKPKAPQFNANPSQHFNYMQINKTLDSLANHHWRGSPTTISSLSNSSYQSSRTAKYSNSTRATDTESIVMDLTDDKYDICTVKKSDSVLSYRSVTEVTKQGKAVEVILVDDDDVEDDLASIYSRYRTGWHQEGSQNLRRTMSMGSSTSSYASSSASDSSYKSFESGASSKLVTKNTRNPVQLRRVLLQNAGATKAPRVNANVADYQKKLRTEYRLNEAPTNYLKGSKSMQRVPNYP